MHLPNYGVFDEVRYFQCGRRAGDDRHRRHARRPRRSARTSGSPARPPRTRRWPGRRSIVNISASPYERGKPQRREQMVVQRARDYVCPIAFCALVGGQDELVFDGHSFVVRPRRAHPRPLAGLRRGPARRRRRPVGSSGGAAARHAPPRRRARGARTSVRHAGPDRAGRRSSLAGAARAPPSTPFLDAGRRGLRGARPRPARLRREERLRARRARAVGRRSTRRSSSLLAVDALGADRVSVVVDAVALLVGGHAVRRARRSRENLGVEPARAADRGPDEGLRGPARRAVRRAASPTSPRRTCRRASAATC